jgi:hypothetical protein
MLKQESLEQRNFNNMVAFYGNELRLLLDGSSVNDIFNHSERSKLRDRKILCYKLDCWYVSDEAKAVLESIQ